MAKSDQGFRLPGGLIIPIGLRKQETPVGKKLGKLPPEGKVALSSAKPVISKSLFHGMEVIHHASIEEHHKLEPDERKARRADNKFMKRSRQMHRRRKKHGRS